jgi:hypothetical protein
MPATAVPVRSPPCARRGAELCHPPCFDLAVTRVTPGGNNRIAFGPAVTASTDLRVHPRIRLPMRWHDDQAGSS